MKTVVIDQSVWKADLARARLCLGTGKLAPSGFLGLVDRLITTLGAAACWDRPDAALVALGGYGRGELSPRSDIDLLFLCNREGADSGTVESVLYPLWDLGFDVGHALRTPRECGRIAGEDLTAATALMDARLLLGSRALLAEAQRLAGIGRPNSKEQRRWAAQLLAEVETRRSRFGEVSHLLEPHLKEGRGGLRDFQAARWLSACLGSGDSLRAAIAEGRGGYDYLLRVRSALHIAAGRKTDHLTFDFHRDVAANVAPGDGLDAFFASLHRASHTVLATWEAVAAAARPALSRRLLRRECTSPVPVSHLRDALLAWMASDTKLPAAVRATLAEAEPAALGDTLAGAARQALESRVPLAPLLRELYHLGRLGLVAPEVEAVAHQVHYDARHAFTTGVHCLETLGAFEDLWLGLKEREEPHLTLLAGAAARPQAIRLAALCHDLGKAHAPATGRDHAAAGIEITRRVARRLGLAEEDAERAACLVGRHHVLTDIAFGRDVEDSAAWADARAAGLAPASIEDLVALAYADLRATNLRDGSRSWSEWRRDLLLTLYARATRDQEPGVTASTRGFDEGGRVPPKEAAQVPADLLRRLLAMAEHLGERPAAWEIDTLAGGFTEILGVAHAAPRLLSTVTGALTALRFDILSFQVHTWADGTVHLWLRAVNPDAPPAAEVARRLTGSLTGEIAAPATRKPTLADPRADAVPVELTMRLRPGDDPYHSVLELRCRDRQGLIRDLARVFERFGLTVTYALVTTAGPMAQDVFHLRDLLGGRIEGESKTRALLEAVADVARPAEGGHTTTEPARRAEPAQTHMKEGIP